MINVLIFIALPHYVSQVIKLVCEKCDKNISKENCVKLRNYLSRMKELDQIVGHNERAPLFDKRVLGQSKSTGGC